MIRPRANRLWLHSLMLISGACGLGCQLVWTRLFAGGFGQEMPAVLAVVAAFLGGLALGAWQLDRWVARTGQPARWYGSLELVIGIWVLFSAWLVPWVNARVPAGLGVDPSPFAQWTVALVVPALALLPATAAMGATLPAMVRLARPTAPDARAIGSLYAANTLGAVTGTLLGAVALVPALGFRGTLCVLAAGNLLCGLVALALRPPLPSQVAVARPPAPAPAGAAGRDAEALSGWILAALLGGTGLLGIGYELLAVRLLSEVLEDTIFTFALVLAVFLAGTAAGAAAESRWFPRWTTVRRVGALLAGLAAACAFGALTLPMTPDWYTIWRERVGTGLGRVMLTEAAVAATILTLPTLFMGATFAALAGARLRSDGRVGRAVAWNTLGGLLAPLVFGVVVLPGAGARWAFTSLVGGYAGLILWAGWAGRERTDRSPRSEPDRSAAPASSLTGRKGRAIADGVTNVGVRWGAGAVSTAALIVTLVGAPDTRALLRLLPGESVRAFRTGPSASAAVVATPDGQRTLRVNNRFTMGGTASANAERRHSHLPLQLHPAPRRALFLGVGTGISFGAMHAHPDLTADGVELLPEVAAVMSEFAPENAAADWAGRLRFHVADARRYVRATSNRYDVIVADLFHPGRDGAGNLYTREHFAALRARLLPGGLVCQWLPLYQLDAPTFRLIARTFLAVFPDATTWLLRPNLDTPVVGLIGSIAPRRYSAEWLTRRVRDDTLQGALKLVALDNPVLLLSGYLGGAGILSRYVGTGPLNTDDRPLVTFLAPRGQSRSAGDGARLLFELIEAAGESVDELVEASPASAGFRTQVADAIAARNLYLRGLAAEDAEQSAEAARWYVDSARRSADFTTGYARALTLAMTWASSDRARARALLEALAAARPEQPIAPRLLRELDGRP